MKQEDLDIEKAIADAIQQYAQEDQERHKDQPYGRKRGQWLMEVSCHLAHRIRLAIQQEEKK